MSPTTLVLDGVNSSASYTNNVYRLVIALLLANGVNPATAQIASSAVRPNVAASSVASAVTPAKSVSSGIEYVLPNRGAPKTRVGAAVRGDDKDAAKVVLWAPEHTGYTTSAHPVLYWTVDRPALAAVEITVVDDNQVEPVLQKVLPGVSVAGLQKIDLAALGVSLNENITYRWFVSVVVDPKRRSNDVLVGGTIVRVPPKNMTVTDALSLAREQARQGLWFDAVHTLQQAAAQGDQQAATLLSQLLQQGAVQR